MKKNPATCGLRTVMRMLGYSLVFIAIIGIRENFVQGGGAVSTQASMTLNRILMASSKLGLGLAQMAADAPNEKTTIGAYSRSLETASRRGFIHAAKMDIYIYAAR
jgi:hypothetical protein